MTTTLANALTLLLIGMITVFTVLALVVGLGHLLIYLTNKWTGDTPAPPMASGASAAEVAAIVAAVDVVTKGQGHVVSIESKKE